jgi:hypothetical protein
MNSTVFDRKHAAATCIRYEWIPDSKSVECAVSHCVEMLLWYKVNIYYSLQMSA